MRFVFVMDPLDRVTHDKDTTFAFIKAAQARGHESLPLPPARPLHPGRRGVGRHAPGRDPRRRRRGSCSTRSGGHALRARTTSTPSSCARIRPSIAPTSTPRWCSSAPAARRSSSTIRAACATPTRSSTPSTSPSGRRARWSRPTAIMIHDFVRDVGGVAMVKPLDGAGGMGVHPDQPPATKNARAIVDMLTHEGHRLAMVQEFPPLR